MKTIQDILPLIEQPSQYLGTEINRIKKTDSTAKLRVALVFPDLYEIGTSHFGIQILYHILNRHPDIVAERVFSPGLDMERYLKSSKLPIVSLESHTPLNQFDIIGFSLLYELNYTNILTILDLANIPFFASKRDETFPLIIAGGPCTCNPEPVADFFDAMVIGDGEEVIVEMANKWLQWKENQSSSSSLMPTRKDEAILKIWSGIEGVYIPSFFGVQEDLALPLSSDYIKVSRAIVNNLDTAPFPDAPIIPYGKPIHDRLRLEVSRGCTRGCRFCQAGMIYRPVRERSLETLLSLTEKSVAVTGYEDISLLSLSTGDYRCIVPLMERLMTRCEAEHTAISFPSLRAGTLTPELMNLVKRVRKTGFTIAPEAGSQRLRDVINKNVTEKEIFDTVSDAFNLGWQVIKLYFMIGLPTETDEDLDALIDLAKELCKIKGPKGRKGKINVSVGTFVPKPHTPFQWASQISLAESKDRLFWIRDRLKMPGIQFKWQRPEVSLLEGLWARGDRRLSHLLVTAYQKGCKFDGWSDQFQYHLWEEALSDEGIDIDFYTTRARNTDEPLPWDHIDIGVTKEFLKQEWENALIGKTVSDCRDGNCHQCGVCDFKHVKPVVFEESGVRSQESATSQQPTANFKKLKISYSKQDQAKYFGHLELVKIFLRAIKRAGIPVKFSEGFHPMPKVSFDDPLPIGMESLNEFFYLTVPESVKPQMVMIQLNPQLPEGLMIHKSELALTKAARHKSTSVAYEITLKSSSDSQSLEQENEFGFDEKRLREFTNCSELILTKTNPKGRVKEVDLKEMVLEINLLSPYQLKLTLKSEPGKTVRPAEVIKEIFSLPDEVIKHARILKTGR